jgi:hypothetical protein
LRELFFDPASVGFPSRKFETRAIICSSSHSDLKLFTRRLRYSSVICIVSTYSVRPDR